jgi:hypothetical protein
MPLEVYFMKAIEVVTAEFLIHTTFALKVIADDQQAMSYSDERSFTTSSSDESFELGGQVAVLRSYCCPRGLTCHTAQPGLLKLHSLLAYPYVYAIVAGGRNAAYSQDLYE